MNIEFWELASYITTALGFPLGIALFVYEQKKERDNEEEAIHQMLSESYTDFMKLVLEHPDLKLRTTEHTNNLTDEQKEKMFVLFDILINVFERAYLMAYSENMNERQTKRWNSWEDFMREWCRREDFRAYLPSSLDGEDIDFANFLLKIYNEEKDKIIK